MPAVATSPTATADRLLAGLVGVAALDGEQAALARTEFLAACPDGDATLLADHLVQHGLLTSFQAERALLDGPDTLELGRYVLVEPIGSGSVGTTYRAADRSTRERYAVRVLPLRSTWRTLQARRRLEVFAAVPAHPAVVPFADVDSAAGRHYLAWPWADGVTFDRLVLRNGPFAPAEACRHFAELADGLHTLHAAGIPHGLIRPKSLLLGHDRQPRLLDLGVGGILADNVADERSMVDTMALASGSAAMIDYTAPETLLDPTAGSPAADAYSFGCTLYFALTGQPPFPDERLADKVIGHQHRSPVPVRTHNPAVPPQLADLVDRLMRKAADERPADFADVRAELRAIADLPELAAEVPTSKTFRTVKAEALAALGDSVAVSSAYTRRADLPPASDVVDFDDVPYRPPPHPVEPDDDEDTPAPLPPPKTAPPPPPKIEQRMIAADADPRPTSHSRKVEIPSPPAFDSAAARAARSVLFWKKPTDAVQLSVFGPLALVPGQRARLLVYAHLPDAFGGVATLCRALHPDAELLGSGYVQRLVPRDSVVQLHLTVPGGSVPKPLVEFTWVGQTQPRSFEVTFPQGCAVGETTGRLSAGWQKQKVAEVDFRLHVAAAGG
jgi:serine/threonine protein kinase